MKIFEDIIRRIREVIDELEKTAQKLDRLV
jgi:hypothetical protein